MENDGMHNYEHTHLNKVLLAHYGDNLWNLYRVKITLPASWKLAIYIEVYFNNVTKPFVTQCYIYRNLCYSCNIDVVIRTLLKRETITMHCYHDQEYIVEREGEYPTSLWAYVTTLYGGHDLCNDIHMLEASFLTVHGQ